MNLRIFRKTSLTRYLVTMNTEQRGFGRIKGRVRKQGLGQAGVSVRCYAYEGRNMLWEVKTDEGGFYALRNIAVGLDCFIVVLDTEAGAFIKEHIIAK